MFFKLQTETSTLQPFIHQFELYSFDIVDMWVKNKNVLKVLDHKSIDTSLFRDMYAPGVLEYFIKILKCETEIGNCPIMHQMLETFASHHLSSEEIFLICSGFRRALIQFTFDEDINSVEAFDEINEILDLNFAGVIRKYDQMIDTQMKNLEFQYKKFQEYADAVDKSANIVKTDSKGFITYVNDSFVKTSGYSRKKLLGKTHRMLRHTDTPKALYTQMWNTILGKKMWFGTLQNRAKNGHSYYINTTIVPLLDENNEIKEFLSIQYEVTELIEATHKAQEAEQAKAQFVASMSHELRTPLNAIIGFSQILSARNDTPDMFKTYIEKIAISGQNLLQLVNNILDFSKFEAGKMKYFFQPFRLSNVLDEVNVLLEPQCRNKGVQISMPDTNILLTADKQLIKQTFLNLFSNAIKFTSKNSCVRLSYDCDDLNRLHFFSVHDEGSGLNDRDVNGLFLPFYQGDNSQQNALKGTGLGLTICQHIIQNIHKGKIWAENNPNGGAVFSFTLPFEPSQVSEL